MKILIIAYHFYPDITPRAFRAFELVKEFAKEGHEVTVNLPNGTFNYEEICKRYNFKVTYTEYNRKSSITQGTTSNNNKDKVIKNFLKKILKKSVYCIFPSGMDTKFYFLAVYKKLLSWKMEVDMILSIATPYDTHIGTAMAMKKNEVLKKTKLKIADYGDPLYKNPALPNCMLYYWIDKFITSNFQYITVPTDNAVSIFETFKAKKNIKVIPQGFDFQEVKLADYCKNDITTFAYAGLFYQNIRNPKPLLDFLLELDNRKINFHFIIYTKTNNYTNMKLLESYKIPLEGKLIIKDSIPREDVIYELSKMDFLINIENLSDSQTPSKLIDYALTKRPILSFNQLDFSGKIFLEFMSGNYSARQNIDIQKYDIKNVCRSFLELENFK